MNNIRAFTTKYSGITNNLKTEAKIKSLLSNNFENVISLWDTGAACSCISEDLAKRMNLVPTGMKNIKTAAGISNQYTYCIDLYLPNNVILIGLPVCDCKINNQNLDILIGMDVISKGDFSISNYNGKTYFSFRIPSINHCDYVQELRLNKIIGPRHGKRNNN